jgi:hypothetical protein
VNLLVLWDVDYTLVTADGLGTRLYEVVFREMFGRELTAVAPKAGRTDRPSSGIRSRWPGYRGPTSMTFWPCWPGPWRTARYARRYVRWRSRS